MPQHKRTCKDSLDTQRSIEIDLHLRNCNNPTDHMYDAIRNANSKVVHALIAHRVSADTTDSSGHPLILMCFEHFEKNPIYYASIATLLLEIEPSIATNYYHNRTVLHHLLSNSAYDRNQFVHLLIKFGADPNQPTKDFNKSYPLHLAAINNHQKSIEILLKHGADIDSRDRNGHTPLHYAIKHNRPDLVKFFIENHPEILDSALLHYAAAESTSINIIKYLATQLGKQEVDIDVPSGKENLTALQNATLNKNISAIKLLLELGADPTRSCSKYGSALQIAASIGSDDLILVLLRNQKNLIHADSHKDRPLLHIAVSNGHQQAVITLLNLGALINQRDSQHRTPCIIALEFHHLFILQILVDAGADLNITDPDGNTALHLIISEYRDTLSSITIIKRVTPPISFTTQPRKFKLPTQQEVETLKKEFNEARLRKLIDLGAPKEAKNNNGNTPLHLAAQEGYDLAIRILIQEYFTDINSLNNQEESPLLLAALNGQTKTVGLLLELGADPSNAYIHASNISPIEEEHLKKSHGPIHEIPPYDPTTHKTATHEDVRASKIMSQFLGNQYPSEAILHVLTYHTDTKKNASQQASFAIITDNMHQQVTDAVDSLQSLETWNSVSSLIKIAEILNIISKNDPKYAEYQYQLYEIYAKLQWPFSELQAAVNAYLSGNELIQQVFESDEEAIQHRYTPDLENDSPTKKRLERLEAEEKNQKQRQHFQLFCQTLEDNLTQQSNSSTTPSHSSSPIEQLQLKLNNDFTFPDHEGRYPLHYAAEAGHVRLAEYLIELQPEYLNTPDNLGDTPLHLAIIGNRDNNNIDVIATLIKAGADFEALTLNGETPLKIALESHQHQMIKTLILDYGASFEDCSTQLPQTLLKQRRTDSTQYALGKRYYDGIDVPTNYKKAFEFYFQASEKGHAGALLAIANAYREGIGLDKNVDQAIDYYHLATETTPMAYIELGNLYKDFNTKDSLTEAARCCHRAYYFGHQKNLYFQHPELPPTHTNLNDAQTAAISMLNQLAKQGVEYAHYTLTVINNTMDINNINFFCNQLKNDTITPPHKKELAIKKIKGIQQYDRVLKKKEDTLSKPNDQYLAIFNACENAHYIESNPRDKHELLTYIDILNTAQPDQPYYGECQYRLFKLYQILEYPASALEAKVNAYKADFNPGDIEFQSTEEAENTLKKQINASKKSERNKKQQEKMESFQESWTSLLNILDQKLQTHPAPWFFNPTPEHAFWNALKTYIKTSMLNKTFYTNAALEFYKKVDALKNEHQISDNETAPINAVFQELRENDISLNDAIQEYNDDQYSLPICVF